MPFICLLLSLLVTWTVADDTGNSTTTPSTGTGGQPGNSGSGDGGSTGDINKPTQGGNSTQIDPDIPVDSPMYYLSEIYREMGGVAWKTNNWFGVDDYCQWTGISCNSQKQVVWIDLSNMGLMNQISDAFGQFPELKGLLLHENSLLSTFPESLCNLKQLKYLQLNKIGLTGSIPSCVCGMTSLQYFHADNNNLNGNLPTCLNSMNELRSLRLQCNSLAGNVPLGLENLSNIDEIMLRCNYGLTCTSFNDPHFIYQCGTIKCEECEGASSQCPAEFTVPECGLFRPITEF